VAMPRWFMPLRPEDGLRMFAVMHGEG
jgi:hypothetical protein